MRNVSQEIERTVVALFLCVL